MPANWYSTSLPLSRELYSSPQQFLRHQQPLQYALQLILCTLNLVLGPEICMNVFNQRSVCTNQTWCFTSFLKYLKFQKYISTDHGWINSIFFQACILHYSYLRGKKQHQQQQKKKKIFILLSSIQMLFLKPIIFLCLLVVCQSVNLKSLFSCSQKDNWLNDGSINNSTSPCEKQWSLVPCNLALQ